MAEEDCNFVCQIAKRALDALKADDIPRAIELLESAVVICKDCDNPKLCKAVDSALEALNNENIEEAGNILKEIVTEICE